MYQISHCHRFISIIFQAAASKLQLNSICQQVTIVHSAFSIQQSCEAFLGKEAVCLTMFRKVLNEFTWQLFRH